MAEITDSHHFIPIVEPGILYNSGVAYSEGHSRDVFIKDAEGENQQIGKVWVDQAVFVDWFHPKANEFWYKMLYILYSKIKFSGVWLDMN